MCSRMVSHETIWAKSARNELHGAQGLTQVCIYAGLCRTPYLSPKSLIRLDGTISRHYMAYSHHRHI